MCTHNGLCSIHQRVTLNPDCIEWLSVRLGMGTRAKVLLVHLLLGAHAERAMATT